MVEIASEIARSTGAVALVGAGPVGTALAAALLLNNVQVTWVVRNPARRACLEPFVVRHGHSQLEISLEVANIQAAPERLDPADFAWVILAVKAQQVAGLWGQLSAAGFQRVLAVTNGLHTGGFHLGLLHGGVQLEGGTLLLNSPDLLLRLGPLEGATMAGLPYPPLAVPWVRLELEADVRPAMYRKLILNCAINPLTALLDCENGVLAPLLDSPLVTAVIDEGCQVARAVLGEQACFSRQELQRSVAELVQATSANSSSMREDLRLGRETEIAFMNLALARQGQEHGISCPINQALGHMVSLIANRGTV